MRNQLKIIYANFNPENMILRDHLAYERTIIANERTLLAYLRSFIMLLGSGLTFIKIIDDPLFQFAGFFLIPISFGMLGLGFFKYFRLRAILKKIYQNNP